MPAIVFHFLLIALVCLCAPVFRIWVNVWAFVFLFEHKIMRRVSLLEGMTLLFTTHQVTIRSSGCLWYNEQLKFLSFSDGKPFWVLLNLYRYYPFVYSSESNLDSEVYFACFSQLFRYLPGWSCHRWPRFVKNSLFQCNPPPLDSQFIDALAAPSRFSNVLCSDPAGFLTQVPMANKGFPSDKIHFQTPASFTHHLDLQASLASVFHPGTVRSLLNISHDSTNLWSPF